MGYLFLVVSALFGVAASPVESVPLSANSCFPATDADLASLGSRWRPFAPFAQICVVLAPDGSIPLTVAIVRLDKGVPLDLDIPNLVIRDVDGHVVGMLPEGFPVDPPGRLRVVFRNWNSDFPWRIDLYETGTSAVAPHILSSLYWNPDIHHYEQPK